MALPLPKVVPDTAPGGGLVTAMGGINALNDAYQKTRYNKVKADYAPTSIAAQAASQAAYARLMYPQFMAKLMADPGFKGNTSDETMRNNLQMLQNAGNIQGTNAGPNNLNNVPQTTGSGQPHTNALSSYFSNLFKSLIGQGQQGQGQQQQSPNSLQGGMPQQGMQQPQQQPRMQQGGAPQGNQNESGDNLNHELDAAYDDWAKSPEVAEKMERGEDVEYPSDEAVLARWRNKNGQPPMKMELNKEAPRQKTYNEKEADYKSIINEGEALGTARGKTISEIGEQQLALSNSGANLDRIINDINDPKFMSLRNEFPFYQDMQLTALSKVGSPEQQEMIGNFIADVKSFAGATVNSFRGGSMKREFDFADSLKPNENDTVNTARGKLTALKSLKEIGERKNNIILDLMQNKHMSVGDAVKQANKMVDVKAIGEEVKKLTSPLINVTNPKTGMTLRLPLWEARQRGVKNA